MCVSFPLTLYITTLPDEHWGERHGDIFQFPGTGTDSRLVILLEAYELGARGLMPTLTSWKWVQPPPVCVLPPLHCGRRRVILHAVYFLFFIFRLACSSLSLPVYTERLHLRVICNTGCTPYSCKVSGLQTRRCPHWRSPFPSRLELFCVSHHEFLFFGLDDRTNIHVCPRDLSLVVHQDLARFC